MRIVLLVFVLANLCTAGPLSGPLPGFILDSRSGSLRPVMGIPGAMQLGNAVNLPFQVTSAEFDSSGNVAIVISNETPNHLYIIQNFSNPIVTDLGVVANSSTVFAMNKTGKAAILSSPGHLRFLSDIGGANLLSNGIATANLLGPITAGVSDDAGTCALVGTSANSTAALETLCADGSSQRLVTQVGMQIGAIALSNNGQDAILADVAGQQIIQVANYLQSGSFTVLASSKDGISSPVGIQVNGQSAIVADSAASSIFLIDLSGRTSVNSIALNSSPTRLKLLPDRTIALLGDPTVTPFTIFDLQAMRSFFVPTN